jgi:hypothetical protein
VLGVLAALLAAGCGRAEERDASQEGASYRRPKNAAGRADSVRVADAARGELRRRGRTDSLLVASFTRASNGYLVRLVPAADPAAPGTSLWVDEDGSVTLTQEYRP